MSQKSKYQDKEKLTLTMKDFFQISTTAWFAASLSNLLSTSMTTKSLSDILSSQLFSIHHCISCSCFTFNAWQSCSLVSLMAWLTESTSGSNPRKVSSATSAAVEGEGEEVEAEVKSIEKMRCLLTI